MIFGELNRFQILVFSTLYFLLRLLYFSPCGRKMEAAGIEPASLDASTSASTCVARVYFLVQEPSTDKPFPKPAESIFLAPDVLDTAWNEPDLTTDFCNPPTRSRSPDYHC